MDTPFSNPGKLSEEELKSYKGHSLFCSRFSRLSRLESIADTPFEFHAPRTTRRVQTRRSRPYRLSRFSSISRYLSRNTLFFVRVFRGDRTREKNGMYTVGFKGTSGRVGSRPFSEAAGSQRKRSLPLSLSGGPLFDKAVYGGNHGQREECRRGEPEDDHRGQWALNFGADSPGYE